MNLLWCNDRWLDPLDFPLAPTDRGLLLGLGLFETILAVDGQPVMLDRHLTRLRDGCARLGWHPPLPDLRATIVELLERNGLTCGRGRVRLAISGGSGPLHDLTLGPDYQLWLTASPAPAAMAALAVNLAPWVRNERSPLAGLKCASYAENLLARGHAVRLGFDETVLTNTRGHLCEATTANLFAVRDGQLLTPSLASGCLPGITRGLVIELAAQLGIPCLETDLLPQILLAADELFLTSSVQGVVDIARFEQRQLPARLVTQALRQAWQAAAR